MIFVRRRAGAFSRSPRTLAAAVTSNVSPLSVARLSSSAARWTFPAGFSRDIVIGDCSSLTVNQSVPTAVLASGQAGDNVIDLTYGNTTVAVGNPWAIATGALAFWS